MDEETRKAFDNVMLGICAIEGMVLQLLLNDAIRDGDEESEKAIVERFSQIEKASRHFADALKRGEAE